MKAVIFDLDGVLVDACEWHRIALNRALKNVANYEISLADHYEVFNGIPTRKKLEILTQKNIIQKSDHEKIYQQKQKNTVEIIKNKAKKRQEKIALIENLKKEKYIVACFTNSIRETAFLMLEKTGIKSMVDMIVTNQDVINPKPSPEGYNKIVSHFNLNKKYVYIVEDSPKGIQAAEASGCNVIQVKNPDEVSYQNLRKYIK